MFLPMTALPSSVESDSRYTDGSKDSTTGSGGALRKNSSGVLKRILAFAANPLDAVSQN